MKIVVQRVNYCKVKVGGNIISSIGEGVLVLIGIEKSDTLETVNKYGEKILKLGIFEDERGKIGRNVMEKRCDIMVISQITLVANLKKGKKPDFSLSAGADMAKELYIDFVEYLKRLGLNVATGMFGKHMKVEFENDGPVTFVL